MSERSSSLAYYYRNRNECLHKMRERYQRIKENLKKKERQLRDENFRILGKKCSICGMEENTEFHEIHGKKHERSNRYIALHREDFIVLCFQCHKIVHRLVTRLVLLDKIVKMTKLIIEGEKSCYGDFNQDENKERVLLT